MANSQAYKPASREQIFRYRALTTLLSITNHPVTSNWPPTLRSMSADCHFRTMFLDLCQLSDLLIRDGETMAIASNKKGNKITILRLDDHGYPQNAPYSAEKDPLPESAKIVLPGDRVGQYVRDQTKGTMADNDTDFNISSFAEHSAVIAGLLKESHRTGPNDRKKPDPQYPLKLANERLCHYVWMAAEPVIRNRIAVGGCPRIKGCQTYHRNIFWILTQRPEWICEGMVDSHAPGVVGSRLAFQDRGDMLERAIGSTTILSDVMEKGGLVYDKTGRLVYQRILANTLTNLRETFESIAVTKKRLIAAKHDWVTRTTYKTQEQFILATSWGAIRLDGLTSDASRLLQVLSHMLHRYGDRQILRDHLLWLQAVFCLEGVRRCPFPDAYFEDLTDLANWSCDKPKPPRHDGDSEGWDSSTLHFSMHSLPPSRAMLPGDEALVLERDWVAATMAYLDRICLHYTSIEGLANLGNPDTQALLRSKRTLQMQVETVSAVSDPVASANMTSIMELVQSMGARESLSAADVELLGDHIRGGVAEPFRPTLDEEKTFPGQYHVTGILLALHIVARRSINTRSGVVDPAILDTAAAFRDLGPIVASDGQSCPSCAMLARYVDRLNAHERVRTCRLSVPAPQKLWSPCTIPSWLPREAAAFVIAQLEAEAAAWISKQLPEIKAAAASGTKKPLKGVGGMPDNV